MARPPAVSQLGAVRIQDTDDPHGILILGTTVDCKTDQAYAVDNEGGHHGLNPHIDEAPGLQVRQVVQKLKTHHLEHESRLIRRPTGLPGIQRNTLRVDELEIDHLARSRNRCGRSPMICAYSSYLEGINAGVCDPAE